MEVGLLFSGGKDSSLAALLLEPFYDVQLITVHFGVTEDWQHAARAAGALDLPFEAIELDRSIANDSVGQMLEDGYPRDGIQAVHLAALEAIAQREVPVIADGTRRDDRVPSVSRAQAQSIEDRNNVQYLAPLSGFGRGAVDDLVDRLLDVEIGESAHIDRADYEAELRILLAERGGEQAIEDIFPPHEQTAVRGRR